MKRVIFILLILTFCFQVIFFSSSQSKKKKVLYIGMMLATGGLGDRSFNDSAYLGLQQAQKQFGIRYETKDFISDETNIESLRNFARQNFDLIIGIGFENAKYIEQVAKEFTNIKFALIDSIVYGNNIASIVYREQEGDFLMGVLAAILTKSKKVGFIGGMDIDIIRRIESGFMQGVDYQDKSITVISSMAGTFADPIIGKSIALNQYKQGVDIIYNGAGKTGLGIIEAAKEAKKFTIGTSGEQIYLAPGNVIGNRPKRVDSAVLDLVKEIIKDNFKAGVRSLGLKEEGISLGPFDKNLVSDEVLKKLNSLKKDIISGKIIIK